MRNSLTINILVRNLINILVRNLLVHTYVNCNRAQIYVWVLQLQRKNANDLHNNELLIKNEESKI